ncbi:MAG TPA: DUF6152 family protein [Vicinamibacterales bacterium]|nr:DUF6152 family protein [Vicinamibacterales bacterium]
MRTRLPFFFAAGTLILMFSVGPARAHHAFSSEFDAAKPVKLTGTVKKMEWINPHSWLTLEVKNANGTVETWEIEAGAPNAMFRRGFNKNSLPVGTQVVVNGFQAKDGRKRANGRDLSFPDGRRLFLGSSGTGAPDDGRDTPRP